MASGNLRCSGNSNRLIGRLTHVFSDLAKGKGPASPRSLSLDQDGTVGAGASPPAADPDGLSCAPPDGPDAQPDPSDDAELPTGAAVASDPLPVPQPPVVAATDRPSADVGDPAPAPDVADPAPPSEVADPAPPPEVPQSPVVADCVPPADTAPEAAEHDPPSDTAPGAAEHDPPAETPSEATDPLPDVAAAVTGPGALDDALADGVPDVVATPSDPLAEGSSAQPSDDHPFGDPVADPDPLAVDPPPGATADPDPTAVDPPADDAGKPDAPPDPLPEALLGCGADPELVGKVEVDVLCIPQPAIETGGMTGLRVRGDAAWPAEVRAGKVAPPGGPTSLARAGGGASVRAGTVMPCPVPTTPLAIAIALTSLVAIPDEPDATARDTTA